MSNTVPSRAEGPVMPRSDERPHPEVDWAAIEREPEFQELVQRFDAVDGRAGLEQPEQILRCAERLALPVGLEIL